jgi:sRNA-binding regulator protein Hfq
VPLNAPPPATTHREAAYLRQLIEAKAPVAIKLASGETVRGTIEYYDVAFVRLTRQDAPNLFIFKHEIRYIAEQPAG